MQSWEAAGLVFTYSSILDFLVPNSLVNMIFSEIHKNALFNRKQIHVWDFATFLLVYLAMQIFKSGNCCQNLNAGQSKC